jgi:hypothetical protein
MSNRGERQHHERRVYERRRHELPASYGQWCIMRFVGKAPNKPCSCAGCGNPRRFGHVTPAELRADASMREQCESIDDQLNEQFWFCDCPSCTGYWPLDDDGYEAKPDTQLRAPFLLRARYRPLRNHH